MTHDYVFLGSFEFFGRRNGAVGARNVEVGGKAK